MQMAKRYAGIISAGSVIIILVVAYFCDNLVHALRDNSNPNGDVYFKIVLWGVWLTPILFLVLAICLLLLFRFVMHQGKRNIVVSGFFVASGVGILFLPPLSYSGWWPTPIPYFINWAGNDGWFLLSTSTFVTAIGIMSMVLSKEKSY